MLGVTVKTLQRWEREGRLSPAARTQTNRRVYTTTQVRAFQGLQMTGRVPTRIVIYCRVSSAAQRPDLATQQTVLEHFCAARGLAPVEVVKEVGGGLHLLRKQFVALMQSVERYEVKALVIAHKDRLARFGFPWFAQFCDAHGCELLVLNQEQLSPEQEMTQDLMTILHCFSARLYGLRNYRQTLTEALKGPRS